jgi:putative ABC transport system permease protein
LFVVLCCIIFALAKTLKLAMAFMIGVVAIVVIAAALAYLVSKFVHIISISRVKNQTLMLGLSSLWRRLPLSMTQMVGFSLGAMALMLLMMIRTDLMQAWQSALPKDAPNRFVINIQPDQVASVQAFNQTIGIKTPQVFPMIRGRLIAKNGQAITADTYDNERAKRLISREFNLSTAANMQADNQLVQGRWWQADESNSKLVSIEEEIANNLNIQLNDQLTYDIAGSQIILKVSSIRKVEWDSMRANFFAVTPLHTLDHFPASYMTAFYLPKNQDNALNLLVQQFPNLTVIDVASVMNQVRDMMQKMTTAVGFVFIFCVLAGIMVLYAALIATRDARIKESTLLRVLGASRSQAAQIMIIEFTCIAFVAACVAVLVANSLAYYLSLFVMQIPFQFNWQLSLSVFLAALALIPLAAWLVIRGYLRVAPKQLLNSI